MKCDHCHRLSPCLLKVKFCHSIGNNYASLHQCRRVTRSSPIQVWATGDGNQWSNDQSDARNTRWCGRATTNLAAFSRFSLYTSSSSSSRLDRDGDGAARHHGIKGSRMMADRCVAGGNCFAVATWQQRCVKLKLRNSLEVVCMEWSQRH